MTLSETIDSKLVSLSNLVNKLRAAKCPPNSLLILFPHCIQYSKCPQKITLDLGECKRCGKCKVKNLIELAEKYGVQIAVASGGRVALQRVKNLSRSRNVPILFAKRSWSSIYQKLGMSGFRPNTRGRG